MNQLVASYRLVQNQLDNLPILGSPLLGEALCFQDSQRMRTRRHAFVDIQVAQPHNQKMRPTLDRLIYQLKELGEGQGASELVINQLLTSSVCQYRYIYLPRLGPGLTHDGLGDLGDHLGQRIHRPHCEGLKPI